MGFLPPGETIAECIFDLKIVFQVSLQLPRYSYGCQVMRAFAASKQFTGIPPAATQVFLEGCLFPFVFTFPPFFSCLYCFISVFSFSFLLSHFLFDSLFLILYSYSSPGIPTGAQVFLWLPK